MWDLRDCHSEVWSLRLIIVSVFGSQKAIPIVDIDKTALYMLRIWLITVGNKVKDCARPERYSGGVEIEPKGQDTSWQTSDSSL